MLLEHPELIPAIGYYRVSTWHEEKISDEIQMSVIKEAARRRGRRIVDWIPDLDATGRNFKRRIMEAIEAVESGSLEGAREIWVWKFSRFGRSRHGVAVNLARIEQAGGSLISATEDLDAGTAVGEFTRDMLFAIAAFESNRAGEQWREAHTWRRKNGLPATGGHRFGYLWTPRLDPAGKPQEELYLPDQDTAEGLAEAYRRHAYDSEKNGFLPLARWMNSEGLLNPATQSKGGWSLQALSGYMDSGFGAGLLHAHRDDVICPDRGNCPTPRQHYGYLPGAQPSILDDETWLAYRDRREQRKRIPPRARTPKYPFSGIAKCGRCGGGAGAYNGMGMPGYGWRCTRNLSGSGACKGATVTTRLMVETVRTWLAGVERDLDAWSADTDVQLNVRVVDTRAAQARLAERVRRAAQAMDNASRQLAKGVMPEDSYLRVRDEFLDEQRAAEKELSALIADAQTAPQGPTAMQVMIALQLREEWGQLPVARLRDMLMSVTQAIRIWPKGHEPRIEVVPAWDTLAV